ncbi:MAG: hypothetical protein M3O26_03410, partial [Pseudomonadota bacterium]|nr:hypothetical protein [Pseudomonadota bacterium]
SGESLPGNRKTVASEEADLYGMFLDKWTGGAAQTIHVARTADSPPAEAMAEYAACLKGYRLVGPSDPSSTLHLSETPLIRRPYVKLVDPAKWHLRDPGLAIPSGKPTAKAVSDGFAAGLLTFSRTIFDEGHKVAVFTYSFVCGGLCGGGGGVIFDKNESVLRRAAPQAAVFIEIN